MARTKIDPIDPSAVYRCIESFSSEDASITEGARLRGSNAAVLRRPAFFVLDSTPDDEVALIRQARLYPDYPRLTR